MTEADVKEMILMDVGAGLDAPSRAELDALSPRITDLWNLYASKAVWPGLQALYTTKHLIFRLQGRLRNKVSGGMGGLSVSQSDSVRNLNTMYEQTVKEIERQEGILRASSGGTATRMTAIAPVENPYGLPAGSFGDANGGMYRGDAYYRS